MLYIDIIQHCIWGKTIRHIYKNVYLEAIFLNWNAKKLRINNNSIKQMYMYLYLKKIVSNGKSN